MKKIILILLLAGTTLYSANNLKVLNDEEDSDTAEIEMKGNGESCRLWFASSGDIDRGSCRYMVNFKGVKIYCTPKKKMCKTYNEIYAFIFEPQSLEAKELQSSSNNAFSTNPPLSFLNTPVTYFYPNGAAMRCDKTDFYVTVNDMAKYSFKKEAVLEWEHLGSNQHILTATIDDKFSGKRTVVKILFIEQSNPARALMDRVIIDGQELTMGKGLSTVLQRYTYAAYFAKIQKQKQ